MIENQIILISTEQNQEIPDITNTYTLPSSRQSEFVQISGGFEIKHTGPLTLTIVQPDKSEVILTTISRDGKFTATMELTAKSQIGIYIVYAEIKGEQHLVASFSVKDRNESKVPSWIKQNALWWSESKITDSEFVNGIEFLVENKIIKLENPSKIPSGPGKTQDSCLGEARCFLGKITEIVDGDTVKINDYSVRFALASAPELDQPNGIEAKEFISKICPIGSLALVDEDDGQKEGSYGRILAVIYCNDKNLNSELLDSNLGYLSSEFCQISEFSDKLWVQKHGCSQTTMELSSVPFEGDCDSSYPEICIPSPPPDLDCKDISYRNFKVIPPDPHNFDGDENGIGCEK